MSYFARLGMAVSLTLVAAACGGDDDGTNDDARTLGPTTASTSEAESDPETTTTSAREDDLSKIVLQLNELPSGFAVSPPEEDDSDDLCGSSPTEEVREEREAEATYTKGDFGPSVVNVVAEYSDEATAENFMELVTSIFEGCREYTDPEDETTYTFNGLSFPDLGDDTFAVRMAADTAFGPFNGDLVYVRVADRVAVFGNLGLGTVDTDLTEEIARLVVGRM